MTTKSLTLSITASEVEAVLEEYGTDVEHMIREMKKAGFKKCKPEDAELRGNLIPDQGDEPRYLSWSNYEDVDPEELLSDVVDYARQHIEAGYDEFSITLSCYLQGDSEERDDDRWYETVDVEIYKHE